MPEDDSLARRPHRAFGKERLARALRRTGPSRVGGVAAPTTSGIGNAAGDTRLSSVRRLMDALPRGPETALTGAGPEWIQPSRDAEPCDLGVPR